MSPQTLLDHFSTITEATGGLHRLRTLVLELAFTGGLATHDAGDEAAEAMLHSIAQDGLVASSGLTQAVNEDDGLWSLPDNWSWARLKQVCDFSPGKTPATKDSTFWADQHDDDQYSWVSISDMPDGGVVLETSRHVSAKAAAEVFRREPAPIGTMLMSFKLTIGKMARLGVPAFHNEAIISITSPFPETNEYLFRVLPLLARAGNSKAAVMGNTLNKTSLTNLLIPVPPLAEQARIVAKVDSLMSLCNELESAMGRRDKAARTLAMAAAAGITPATTGAA